MADIVLATINAKWIHPSLALRLLKANLGELADRAEILEFALRQRLEEKAAPILAASPRILGLSVYIWNHAASLELLQELERRWVPGTKPCIVLGGPEASHLPDSAALLSHADWVVRGEGEIAFRELCESLLAPGGPGQLAEAAESSDQLAKATDPLGKSALPAQDGNPKFIEKPPVELGELHFAYQLYTQEDLTKKLVYVESSRGCPFSCAFCLSALRSPAPGHQAVRDFPLEPFFQEMEQLLQRGASSFKFLDRSFNSNPARSQRILAFFLEQLEKRIPPTHAKGAAQTVPFYLHLELVPRSFTPASQRLLAQFPPNTLRLEVGIQTLNPAVAAIIKRSGVGAEALESLRFLRKETSALLHVDLIAGLPGEGWDSFAQGFNTLWMALHADVEELPERLEIQLGILKLLPGTPLAGLSEDYGMRYAPEPPYEVLETAALPREDLNRIKNFARFWELLVNRGRYPGIAAALTQGGLGIFEPFMALADWLLLHFRRNWGLDSKALEAALADYGILNAGNSGGSR